VDDRFEADFVEKVRGCRGAVVLIQSGAGIGSAADDGGRSERAGRSVLRVFARAHVPAGHLLRSIDRFVDLDGVRCELAPF
jgi:hypothetical protein